MVSFRVQGTTPRCQTAGQRAVYRASWLSDTCELHEKKCILPGVKSPNAGLMD